MSGHCQLWPDIFNSQSDNFLGINRSILQAHNTNELQCGDSIRMLLAKKLELLGGILSLHPNNYAEGRSHGIR